MEIALKRTSIYCLLYIFIPVGWDIQSSPFIHIASIDLRLTKSVLDVGMDHQYDCTFLYHSNTVERDERIHCLCNNTRFRALSYQNLTNLPCPVFRTQIYLQKTCHSTLTCHWYFLVDSVQPALCPNRERQSSLASRQHSFLAIFRWPARTNERLPGESLLARIKQVILLLTPSYCLARCLSHPSCGKCCRWPGALHMALHMTQYHSTDTRPGWAKKPRPPGARDVYPRSGKVMMKISIMLPICSRTKAWQKLTKRLNGWLIFAIKPWPKIRTGERRLKRIWKRTTQRATFTLLSEEIVRLARPHPHSTGEQVRLLIPLVW